MGIWDSRETNNTRSTHIRGIRFIDSGLAAIRIVPADLVETLHISRLRGLSDLLWRFRPFQARQPIEERKGCPVYSRGR